MYITLHDDIFMSLYFSSTTGTAGGRVQEEPLAVFANRGMAYSHTGELGTQRVSEPNK